MGECKASTCLGYMEEELISAQACCTAQHHCLFLAEGADGGDGEKKLGGKFIPEQVDW